MLKIELVNKFEGMLNNAKYGYKSSIRCKKNTLKLIKDHKELGIFTGDVRKTLLSRLETDNRNLRYFFELAVNYARKKSFINTLLTDENIETDIDFTVEKLPLEIDNDYDESDRILESGDVTRDYANSRYYYNDRIDNNFIGTYPVKIQRIDDYKQFIDVLIDDAFINNLTIDFTITFKEWKTGYKIENSRQNKLNKYLRKKGFSQYVLDYYSQQIKVENTLYITISDRVQHIAGMSYYSTGEWTGMNGSSCQDPRNEYEECVRLLPSLHDDKLLIAFLHESLDDLEDMEEKMIARSMARIVHIDEKQFLITTKNYGSMESIDILEKGLRQLNRYNIFTVWQMDSYSRHSEDTNGRFYLNIEDEIYVCDTYEDYVICECPACGGSGDFTVTTNYGNDVDVECPACGGSGETETYVSVYIDETVYVDVEEELTPYNEGYDHYGDSISIRIDRNVLGLD